MRNKKKHEKIDHYKKKQGFTRNKKNCENRLLQEENVVLCMGTNQQSEALSSRGEAERGLFQM